MKNLTEHNIQFNIFLLEEKNYLYTIPINKGEDYG
jgi:hypothetical protein